MLNSFVNSQTWLATVGKLKYSFGRRFLMRVVVNYLWYEDVVKITLLRFNGRTHVAPQRTTHVVSTSRWLFSTPSSSEKQASTLPNFKFI